MNASIKTFIALTLALTLVGCASGPKRPQPPESPSPATDGAAGVPDKGDPEARFREALAQMEGKQLQEAEQAFLALTKDFPEFSGPWTNLGILYANSNRKPQAFVAFNKAAVLNQENAVALNWIGILSRETRQYARAHAAYERVLALQPDNALAHYNLAILLDEHLKRPLDALPHYRAYQRLAGQQDLKVLAWVAEIEATHAKTLAANQAPAVPAQGAAAKPGEPQP